MLVLSRAILCCVLGLLAACQRAQPPAEVAAPAAAPSPRAMAAELARLVDSYWERYLALNPTVASASGDRRFEAQIENTASLTYLADSLALEREALSALARVRPELLDAGARLTYEVFRVERETAVEGFLYPQELLPVEPFDSMPQLMAQLGAGEGAHPFIDARGYEDWLGRIEAYAAWTDQAIGNLREGMRRGYLLPRPLVERLLPQLQELARERGDSRFLLPLQQFPPGIDAGTRQRLDASVRRAVSTQLLPAYRKLHDFLKTEYLPRSRSAIGMSAQPMGDRWYDYRLRRVLGNATDVAHAQSLAQAEVQRAQARLGDLAAQSGFGGNLPGYLAFIRQDARFRFLSPAEMLEAFRSAAPPLTALARTAMPQGPEAALPILPQPDTALEDEAAAHFVPLTGQHALLLLDIGRWQRTPRNEVAITLLREGDPGKYLQRWAQFSQTTLPRFRRFGRVMAFESAWAAYAGSLGDELGGFSEPDARLAAVLVELRDALLAVTDIGIHARGWSRQQAVDQLREHLPIDEATAALAVDRCIAQPAAALASSLGAARIRALRARAQAALGSQFDARAFHAQLLSAGAMPLDVLERHMDAWIRSQPR